MKTDNQWVAPTDFGVIRSRQGDPYAWTSDYYSEYFDIQEDYELFWFRLLQMWYHAALIIMMVDICGRTKLQLIFLIVIYILMAIINAIIFGLLFDLIEVLSKKDNQMQQEIDMVNTAMSNLELTLPIKTRVRTYIISTQETKYQQNELIKFTESMPPSRNRLISSLNFQKALN